MTKRIGEEKTARPAVDSMRSRQVTHLHDYAARGSVDGDQRALVKECREHGALVALDRGGDVHRLLAGASADGAVVRIAITKRRFAARLAVVAVLRTEPVPDRFTARCHFDNQIATGTGEQIIAVRDDVKAVEVVEPAMADARKGFAAPEHVDALLRPTASHDRIAVDGEPRCPGEWNVGDHLCVEPIQENEPAAKRVAHVAQQPWRIARDRSLDAELAIE